MFDPGSSPLSRGILPLRRRPLPWGRIIPALAGNTGTDFAGAAGTPDHPRSRGEYPRTVAAQDGVLGSSPLSRGIPGNRE